MDSLYHTDPTAAVEALGRLPHLALEYLGGTHLGWEVVEKDSPDRLAVLRTDTRRGAAPHAPERPQAPIWAQYGPTWAQYETF